MRQILCLLLALTIFFPKSLARAVEGGQEICETKERGIVFVNGIKNDYDSAVASRDAIKKSLKKTYLLEQFARFSFKISFNRTFGFTSDLIESRDQKIGIEKLQEKWNDWFTGKQEWEIGGLASALLMFDLNNLYFGQNGKEDLDEHVAYYRSQIAAGKSELLVAHSQGNHFAVLAYINLVFGLNPIQRQSLSVVSVASPLSFVVGYGHYITLTGDKVIGAVSTWGSSAGVKLPLVANITNDQSTNLGHYFVDDYFSEDSKSQKKIIEGIRSVICPINHPPKIFVRKVEGE